MPHPKEEAQTWEEETKPRQRMEGHCMLYADYFADVPAFTPKGFLSALSGEQRFVPLNLRWCEGARSLVQVEERLRENVWVLITSEVYCFYEDVCIWSAPADRQDQGSKRRWAFIVRLRTA